MMPTSIRLPLVASVLTVACGGTAPKTSDVNSSTSPTTTKAAVPTDPAAEYAPLEEKYQWAQWPKMNTEPFFSKSHGKRFVDVYVNNTGEAAFKDEELEFPVGSIIVKSSWEIENGKPTEVAGPVFLMEKMTEGFDPDNEDWWYGFHWETVTPPWIGRIGERAYWRSPSKKVNYCGTCHEDFNRFVGGVDADYRSF